MTKQRIYAVKIHGPDATVRLVRATNVSVAIRHVAETLIVAEVATQDTLVSMLMAGATVEETSEPAPAAAPATTDESLRLVPRQAQA